MSSNFEVLHIANDFSGSKVYKKLFEELDELNISQIVYTAIRNDGLVGNNKIEFKTNNSYILYSNILKLYDRVNFFAKINKIVGDIEKNVDFTKVDIIHSHTWYSDGAVAYVLAKKYNIPYVVTIRNTDLNVFYKYMLHLRSYGLNILKNADKIIFVSDVYITRFSNTTLFEKNCEQLNSKLVVLYNGIDNFWINNVKPRKFKLENECFKLLYVGKFDKGKNVERLVEVVKLLNKDCVDFTLTLIGGGGSEEDKILKQIEGVEFVNYLGPIFDKIELAKCFASHDLFTMPSKAETFGLVYLEAISQGIPILNTKNEGIDGMYINVGESVVYNDINSIANGILKIKDNYLYYNFDPKQIINNHQWQQIAIQYQDLYSTVCNEK